MAFVSNPAFLAAAFINCSAAFVLLVVYVLLAPGFSARFFRYWLGGWTLYVFAAALRVSYLWNGISEVTLVRAAVSLLTAMVLFAALRLVVRLACRELFVHRRWTDLVALSTASSRPRMGIACWCVYSVRASW